MKPILSAVLLAALSLPLRAESDREVVKVNGAPIRQSEVMERLWKRYGPATLEEMVDELLLRQAAAALKIKADPAEVNRKLARIKEQFGDSASFEKQLAEAGTTLEKLKADISEQLVLSRLVIDLRKISVKDEEVKKAFDTHKEKLAAPAAVHLKHILVKTEPEAKDVVEKIKGGADFAKLAAEKSLAPTGKLKGGDYGFVSKGMLPPEIEELAFSMKAGELRTMPSAKGFHVFQALALRPAKPAKFSEVREELKDILLAEKIKAVLPAYLQELRRKADIQPQGA
jgi:foldase protein PrsA